MGPSESLRKSDAQKEGIFVVGGGEKNQQKICGASCHVLMMCYNRTTQHNFCRTVIITCDAFLLRKN